MPDRRLAEPTSTTGARKREENLAGLARLRRLPEEALSRRSPICVGSGAAAEGAVRDAAAPHRFAERAARLDEETVR